MDSATYTRLSKHCSFKEHNREQAEDLLHDSILLSLEKNSYVPGFIFNTFKFKRKEAARAEYYKTKIYSEFAIQNYQAEPSIEGKAIDYNEALKTLYTFLETKFRYSHISPSKRVESFLRMYVFKQSSNEISEDLKTSPASVRNMACVVRTIVKANPRLKDVVEILEL